MRQKNITELMDRFMDGETTLNEETQLAAFFRQASDKDKPAGMDDGDWQAWREMFRQFDEGLCHPLPKPAMTKQQPSGIIYKIAATIVFAIGAALIMTREDTTNKETMYSRTYLAAADSIEVSDTAESADSIISDTTVLQKPRPSAKRRTRQTLPYRPVIPRPMIASTENEAEIDTDADAGIHTADNVHMDSVMMAAKEVDALIETIILYQEMQISDICEANNYEEEYYEEIDEY